MHDKKKIFFIINVIVILLSSIGYAQLSNISLDISGTAISEVQDGIFISEASIISNVGANMSDTNIILYNQTVLSSNVSLSTSDSSSNVVMSVTIFNNSGVTQYYDGIRYDPNFYSNSNIVAETDNSLQLGQSLASGASVTFSVIYHYDNNYIMSASTPYDNELNSYISFSFISTPPGVNYNVTYVNFTGSTYPAYAASGEDFVVSFNAPVPTNVYVDGSSSYTYANGVLTVYNVQNDLTIENITDVEIPITDDANTTFEIHAPGIESTNSVAVNDLLNMSFDGLNYTDTIINRIDVILTYTTTTGSPQSINCILTVNGVDTSQTVNFAKKQTNATVTTSFTGLSLDQADTFTVTYTRNNLTNANIQISDMRVLVYFQS